MKNKKRSSSFYFIILLAFLIFYLFKDKINESVIFNNKSTDSAYVPDGVSETDTVIVFDNKQDGEKDSTIPASEEQIILLCGDSMAGGLSEPFENLAEFHNYTFYKYIWGASTTAAWSATGKLKRLIDKYNPTIVILVLGSNELMTKSLSTLKVYVSNVIKQAKDVNLVWIGPPNWKEDNGFNETLKNILGAGQYFDSENLMLDRVDDGKHLTQKGYYAWADSVSQWIEKKSSSKIKITAAGEYPGAGLLK